MKNSENIKHPANLQELILQLKKENAEPVRYRMEMEEFLRVKALEEGIPMYGKFELTPLCNLDCKMCYVHLKRDQLKGSQLLSVAQWQHLMKEAADAGMQFATLTGGECLTYPGFQDLYLYLQSMGVQIIVMTNGVLISEEWIRFFTEHPPKIIQISLYGSTENAYEKVTGHRYFRQVMQGIQIITKAGLPLQIAVTPSRYMEDGEEIIRLADHWGDTFIISASLFDPYEETGRKGQQVDMPEEDYLKLYRLQAMLCGRELRPGCLESLPLPKEKNVQETPRGVRCGAGRSGFVITWDGRIQPCSMLRGIQRFPLKEGFANSWECIHQSVENILRPIECEICRYQNVCIQCVAEHARTAPEGHASPKVCAWRKRL
ncbi:MAG: radical SAM protein, partial [Lachnospiraceae bacterium]|nr:radical SAM protein [Lachnospiraceae bacterium]